MPLLGWTVGPLQLPLVAPLSINLSIKPSLSLIFSRGTLIIRKTRTQIGPVDNVDRAIGKLTKFRMACGL